MLGGKMGRELSLKKALREVRDDYDLILIDCPPALGPVDRQRARRRRLRAAVSRGAVLRAAGRRAGARGDRAGPRQPEPGPRVARRRPQHRRHAHPPLPRGVRLAATSTSARSCWTRRSAPRSRTPSRPSARCRSSTTAQTLRSTTWTSPRSCSRASGWTHLAAGSPRWPATTAPPPPTLRAIARRRRGSQTARASRSPIPSSRASSASTIGPVCS